MRQARQPGTLCNLLKCTILCLLLGAALQFSVTSAFGLAPAGDLKQGESWVFTVSEGPMKAGFSVAEAHAFGRVVLGGEIVQMQLEMPESPTKPDWSRGEWSADPFPARSRNPSAASRPRPYPWSRFLTIGTDPDFDYFGVPNWPGFVRFGRVGWSYEFGCGWPMTSASYFARQTSAISPYMVREGLVVSVSTTATPRPPRVIPLRIYWPGALANTLIYAAALLVPFTVVPFARRNLRRRRGRCPACNYDLRATTTGTCPECGAAITPRATT